jgi:hypothetical protein
LPGFLPGSAGADHPTIEDKVMKSAARNAIWLLASLTFAAPVSAPAQQPSQAQIGAVKQSCPADYQKFCSSVPTGGQASLACLQKNAANLSAGCRQAVAALGGGAAGAAGGHSAAPAAAAPATQPHAATTAPGAAQMSPRQKAAMLRQACGYDYRRFCRGIPFGDGRVASCLEGNADRLSPNCGRVLSSLREAR